ncbi:MULTISPECIES: hypothetical protein [Salimicrobium]|uniref:Uncharacterized protein n=1 Tax=Salimicrobium salexigens TaxID=908941 RepID=A0ABY1KKL6_9BACI|nr:MULTISPECIES: hypothetical protein [Salimicrobium]MBM7696382.1 hypothetical protein [Salimicrobium jeotgali]SIS45875.1 hypothetical protein SAMN05421758_101232 [Salimicrobium salexigens]
MTEWVFLAAAIINLLTALVDFRKRVRSRKRSKKEEDLRSDKRKSS